MLPFWAPSHLVTSDETVARLPGSLIEFTAAGTAPDFHGVPLTVSTAKVGKINYCEVHLSEINEWKKLG